MIEQHLCQYMTTEQHAVFQGFVQKEALILLYIKLYLVHFTIYTTTV